MSRGEILTLLRACEFVLEEMIVAVVVGSSLGRLFEGAWVALSDFPSDFVFETLRDRDLNCPENPSEKERICLVDQVELECWQEAYLVQD